MFRRILVPIDGSLVGFELVERAIELASAFEATLIVVYVKALEPGFTQGGLALAPEERASDGTTGSRSGIGICCWRRCRARSRLSHHGPTGERHLAILNAARATEADLIVLLVSTPASLEPPADHDCRPRVQTCRCFGVNPGTLTVEGFSTATRPIPVGTDR